MPTRRDLANAIRALSMDAVQRANSGHPGMPMGMADIAEVLWNDYLKHNPANPDWPDRDRFVLSNGHGSMLLYSVLHLTGYDLPMEELRRFRQLHSKTPGHPEYGDTPGVETTTGPLGQGIANAVGMAIAERTLAARFNKPGHEIVDHRTWVFCGDGCLMEGISHEVCSLAGRLGLGKLKLFYDDNEISIDGRVEGWFTDDTAKRFEAYGWYVIRNVDGHDPDVLKAAIEAALAETARPTLVCTKTIIGFGAPNKQVHESTHGAALGEDEVAAARKELGWKYPPFEIPEDIYAGWDARARGKEMESDWNQRLSSYKEKHPELGAEFERRIDKRLPDDWSDVCETFLTDAAEKTDRMATRKASQVCLDAYGPHLPEFIGGSADLTGSNNTFWSGSKDITKDPDGNYIFFGVREFGMSAICNGIGLHGGFIPYSGTFLIFSDYARNAVRMSALMGIRTIFVYTHDSIGLGEDGPTHQPVEHLTSLRAMPNMVVWRPCDLVETAVAWRQAIERRDGPTSLVLTRQGLAPQERTEEQRNLIARGGYILYVSEKEPRALIIATGSEVDLAVRAAKTLNEQSIGVYVVSMPSAEVFEQQDKSYRDAVLPPDIRARVAVEAGATLGWSRYVGLDGKVIGLDRFGASAPARDVFEYFGFRASNVVDAVKSLVK